MFRHLFDENAPVPKATKPQHSISHQATIVTPVVPRQTAALDNHIRLQQSQEEFLAWIETQRSQDDNGKKNYRKIR